MVFIIFVNIIIQKLLYIQYNSLHVSYSTAHIYVYTCMYYSPICSSILFEGLVETCMLHTSLPSVGLKHENLVCPYVTHICTACKSCVLHMSLTSVGLQHSELDFLDLVLVALILSREAV